MTRRTYLLFGVVPLWAVVEEPDPADPGPDLGETSSLVEREPAAVGFTGRSHP